ncbi:MAG: hypothetical protein ABIH11_05150 [Candidatus Altiarchaeota archaeon]
MNSIWKTAGILIILLSASETVLSQEKLQATHSIVVKVDDSQSTIYVLKGSYEVTSGGKQVDVLYEGDKWTSYAVGRPPVKTRMAPEEASVVSEGFNDESKSSCCCIPAIPLILSLLVAVIAR